MKRLFRAARAAHEVRGTSDLARLLNESPQAVHNWKSRGVSNEGAITAERALGCAAAWVTDGTGPMWAGLVAGEAAPPWSLKQGAETPAISRPLALPRISWAEAGAPGNLPETFMLTLDDDALAPDHPRGTVFIWNRARAPRVGSVVLVRDRHGRLHARRYAQGREPGRWRANATQRDHLELDSQDDGLDLLATAAFRELP